MDNVFGRFIFIAEIVAEWRSETFLSIVKYLPGGRLKLL
jgi:hypothetical protein